MIGILHFLKVVTSSKTFENIVLETQPMKFFLMEPSYMLYLIFYVLNHSIIFDGCDAMMSIEYAKQSTLS